MKSLSVLVFLVFVACGETSELYLLQPTYDADCSELFWVCAEDVIARECNLCDLSCHNPSCTNCDHNADCSNCEQREAECGYYEKCLRVYEAQCGGMSKDAEAG